VCVAECGCAFRGKRIVNVCDIAYGLALNLAAAEAECEGNPADANFRSAQQMCDEHRQAALRSAGMSNGK